MYDMAIKIFILCIFDPPPLFLDFFLLRFITSISKRGESCFKANLVSHSSSTILGKIIFINSCLKKALSHLKMMCMIINIDNVEIKCLLNVRWALTNNIIISLTIDIDNAQHLKVWNIGASQGWSTSA